MSIGGIKLPKGFRFQPSDEVLLSHYLELKNQGKDSEITAIIPEIDVCNHEPRDLPALVFKRAEFLDKEWFTMADSPDMQWYFFSPRVFVHSSSKSKSKSKSTRIKRTTEEGSWKKQGIDTTITSDSSDKPIGGKRFLTFYLSKKQRTDWVIHEYYLTKANSDEQIGDYVLCRLKKNKPLKSGRSDHDQQDAPLCNGGEPSSGSCSVASNVKRQTSNVLGNVVVIPVRSDHDAEYDGGSCSMAFNVENQASKQLENVILILNGYDDEAEHGGGSCHITSGFKNEAAGYDMLTEAEKYDAFKELADAVLESDGIECELKGLQTDPSCIDQISDEGQPDSFNPSDFDMVEELLGEPGDMQSLLHPPSSPQLQSPIYTKSGIINAYNDESRKRNYPLDDNDTFLTKKNRIDEVNSNTASNPENQAAYVIPDGHFQPGENLGSDSFQSHEQQSDPSRIDQISDEGQPDSFNPSDFDMVDELLGEPGDLQSLLHPPSSPQLQSPIYTKPGIIKAYNDESRKRNYPLEDNDTFLTKKNRVDEVNSNTASNPENQAAYVIPEGHFQPGENLGSDSFQSHEQQSDPSRIDQISDEGQPDSFNPSDFDMVDELLGEPGDLQSLLHPPSSPQLQSPIYTKSGIINAYNDESRKRNYPLEDNDTFLTKKNRIDEVNSNTASNPENQAAYVIPEGHFQPGENLGSDSFQSHEQQSDPSRIDQISDEGQPDSFNPSDFDMVEEDDTVLIWKVNRAVQKAIVKFRICTSR